MRANRVFHQTHAAAVGRSGSRKCERGKFEAADDGGSGAILLRLDIQARWRDVSQRFQSFLVLVILVAAVLVVSRQRVRAASHGTRRILLRVALRLAVARATLHASTAATSGSSAASRRQLRSRGVCGHKLQRRDQVSSRHKHWTGRSAPMPVRVRERSTELHWRESVEAGSSASRTTGRPRSSGAWTGRSRL